MAHIDWIGYGWMAGEVSGPSTYFVDLTMEVPRGLVVAAAAVSGLSIGVQKNEPGSVAVYVREYAQFDKSGKPHVIDVPPDPVNNVMAIEDCFFVRFRMTVFQGRGFSQGLVFRFEPPPPATPSPVTRMRKLEESDYHVHIGGKEIGKHRVMRLARGSRLDTKAVQAILKRSTGEAARFLGVPHRELETVRARKPRPRERTPAGTPVF